MDYTIGNISDHVDAINRAEDRLKRLVAFQGKQHTKLMNSPDYTIKKEMAMQERFLAEQKAAYDQIDSAKARRDDFLKTKRKSDPPMETRYKQPEDEQLPMAAEPETIIEKKEAKQKEWLEPLYVPEDKQASKMMRDAGSDEAIAKEYSRMRHDYLTEQGDTYDHMHMHTLEQAREFKDNPKFSAMYRRELKEAHGYESDADIDRALVIMAGLEKRDATETDKERRIREMQEGLDDIFNKKRKHGHSL